jgi:hypothetical protein
MLEGHGQREEVADVRMAWLASAVIAALSGEAPGIEELLGRKLKYVRLAPAPRRPGDSEFPATNLARMLGI